jgi:hypothetical protein
MVAAQSLLLVKKTITIVTMFVHDKKGVRATAYPFLFNHFSDHHFPG